jgi:hypothetical protein
MGQKTRHPKENAPLGFRALNDSSFKHKYKRFPAFGKKLMDLRRVGKIPSQIIMVVFDWKLAKAYPRIVIDDDAQLGALEFSYLSGIPVQIVYSDKDAFRVDPLVQVILEVAPSFLSIFARNLVDTGEATTIIKSLQNAQMVEKI